MKKILTMILLAMLIAFTGCDNGGSSSSVDSETQALADGIAQSVASTMGSQAKLAVNSEAASGISNGVGRASYTYSLGGITVEVVSFTATATTYNMSMTIDYDNVGDATGSIDGTITYNISGSHSSGTLTSGVGSTIGDLTIVSDGTTYTFEFALEMTMTSTSGTVSGYIKIDGDKAEISETVSFT